MVRQIVWSSDAKDDLKHIIEYWNHRNKSTSFSKKLRKLFKEAIDVLIIYPETGRRSDFEKVRINIVRDYHILYECDADTILILRIWDCRQDPGKLNITFTT
jgi:addiction module RelE/StbE family toxin